MRKIISSPEPDGRHIALAKIQEERKLDAIETNWSTSAAVFCTAEGANIEESVWTMEEQLLLCARGRWRSRARKVSRV